MPSKYEQEIDDILKEAGELRSGDDVLKQKSNLRAFIWFRLRRSLGDGVVSVSSGRVISVAVVLLILALVMGISPIAWVGLIFLIVGYAMFFIDFKSKSRTEKRWRGQVIEYGESSWWERIKRRLSR